MSEQGRVGVRVAAVVAPIVVAAAAGLARELVANTSAALVLVLVVVAVGTAGDRVAGALAALSAAAAFDFFLTAPFLSFAILDRDDLETAVLLLAIGMAVTEIALWGRGQQARSVRREGYLTGVAHAARLAAEARSDLVTTVGRMIADVLDLDDCRYDPQPGPPAFHPVLGHDGSLTWGQHTVDVPRDGLPTMDVIELPAGPGRFLLTASSHVRRPDHEQLLVAVTLAEQVGAVSPVRS